MAKFNKTNIIANMQGKIDALVIMHEIDLGNGTAQLKSTPDHLNRIIAYGEIKALKRLLMLIEEGNI